MAEPKPSASRRDTAAAMSEAAVAWLRTLDPEQAHQGFCDWPTEESEAERRHWFYTPTDHGGLPLNRMRPAQQRAAMRLVSTGLSEAGYNTVATIMGLENVLDMREGFAAGFARERGRDPGMYYLRVFGAPAAWGSWAWRFGGHHVSINHLVLDGDVVASTPCFLGAHPASSPLLGGRESRPLGGVEDIGRDLLHSLDREQRSLAMLTAHPPVDLVTGNRTRYHDGDRVLPLPLVWRGNFTGEHADIEHRLWEAHREAEENVGIQEQDREAVALSSPPKGIPGSELGATQRSILRKLLEVYLDRMPAGIVQTERARFDDALLDDVHFAWAGSAERGEPHYYRLQGAEVLAEWENAQPDVNHAHSVLRNPGRDFGLDVLAAHYASEHR
jgi:hypothetical protein